MSKVKRIRPRIKIYTIYYVTSIFNFIAVLAFFYRANSSKKSWSFQLYDFEEKISALENTIKDLQNNPLPAFPSAPSISSVEPLSVPTTISSVEPHIVHMRMPRVGDTLIQCIYSDNSVRYHKITDFVDL